MEKNLTTGSVLKNILFFSLPYLFSYFLQTLYGMADLFIIGQFEGVAATTAVSIGSQVMHMLTVMIVGLAMGTTVSIAQAIGANKKDDAAAATGNTVTLFLILSVCRTVMRNPSDYHDHVRTRRSRFWHYRLPYNLLYRHSFYHSIQHYQFHFPRNG